MWNTLIDRISWPRFFGLEVSVSTQGGIACLVRYVEKKRKRKNPFPYSRFQSFGSEKENSDFTWKNFINVMDYCRRDCFSSFLYSIFFFVKKEGTMVFFSVWLLYFTRSFIEKVWTDFFLEKLCSSSAWQPKCDRNGLECHFWQKIFTWMRKKNVTDIREDTKFT